MTDKQMQAEIDRLKAENETLKASKAPKAGMKVSDKGAVSVYGLGRFPVTLYRSQWEALIGDANKRDDLGQVNAIKAFIKENADKLAVKS